MAALVLTPLACVGLTLLLLSGRLGRNGETVVVFALGGLFGLAVAVVIAGGTWERLVN